MIWTTVSLATAKKILKSATSMEGALAKLSEHFLTPVSYASIRWAFQRAGYPSPTTLLSPSKSKSTVKHVDLKVSPYASVRCYMTLANKSLPKGRLKLEVSSDEDLVALSSIKGLVSTPRDLFQLSKDSELLQLVLQAVYNDSAIVKGRRSSKVKPSPQARKAAYSPTEPKVEPETPEDSEDQVALLVALTKKTISSEDACNKLNIPPKRLKELVKEAKDRGFIVHFENGHLGRHSPARDYAHKIEAHPEGGLYKIAIMSDLHFGSKYCLREQIKSFVYEVYSRGVRVILIPGDILDGCYAHAAFEMTHHGVDAQAQDFFETFPNLDGLSIVGIEGNHDFSFTSKVGVHVSPYLENYFKERGREDLTMLGSRSAYLELGGAIIHLWHPLAGCGYAVSYPIQKQIAKYGKNHVDLLAIGHWHKRCIVQEGHTFGLAAGTFQGGGSAFGQAIGGAPAIGGTIVSWRLTEDNKVCNVAFEWKNYEERPVIHGLKEDRHYVETIDQQGTPYTTYSTRIR